MSLQQRELYIAPVSLLGQPSGPDGIRHHCDGKCKTKMKLPALRIIFLSQNDVNNGRGDAGLRVRVEK